jgi:diadenylate cyclase
MSILEFGIKDIIDIALVALMLYYVYRLMRESRSINVFIGVMLVVLTWLFVSQILEMRLLGAILNQVVGIGAIAMVVIFQAEIRKFLYRLGEHRRVSKFSRFFNKAGAKYDEDKEMIMPIVLACMSMSKNKVGALIVFERSIVLDDIIDSGERIEANINQMLIENLFFKNSPLHDGAIVISKKKIKAAGCILPVAHDQDIPKKYGLRHRAALGITQTSDAVAVTVSEETGQISMAIGGEIHPRLSAEQLESTLAKELSAYTRQG